jgi:hypothetical protein
MFWRVLIDGAGYSAGDILDLNDAEEAARIAALVPIAQIAPVLRFPVERVMVPLPQPELRGSGKPTVKHTQKPKHPRG